MDVVAFESRNGVRLELRRAAPAPDRPADELPTPRVLLSGTGLTAGLVAPEATWGPRSLAAFVGDMADDWRGWDGDRTWQSEEAELRLPARSNRTDTVLVTDEIEDGAPPRRRCAAELELDPGAFEQLAKALRELSGP